LAASAGLAAGASLAVAGSAQATDFPVSGLDDAGGGTLRQAIINANGNSGPDTISFDSGLSGTITLASDLPTITQALAINGPGADKITVSGNDAHRIFDLNPTPAGDPVSISGLTLTGGRSASSVTAAIRGGAILNETAHLTISDSTISGNNGPGSGGGIYSGYPSSPTAGHHADLTVRRSTLSGNHASQGGGAIYLNDGSGHIIDSTISGNTAFWGGGVGIYYMQGPTVIENSTISGNTASGATPDRGGGLYIFRNPAGVTLSSTTVSGNTAEQGGGVFDYGYIPLSGPSNQAPVLHNTIIAGNTATGSGADVSNANGSTFDSAFSLIRDTSTATINETVPGSDVIGQDPQLGALGSNGGATQTMLPVGTSPAIDQGSAFGLATDQRDMTRPIDLGGFPNSSAAGADGSDIGAVELQSPPEPSPAESSPPAAPSPPSNVFTHGKPKLNKKTGTATITVRVPGAGTLTLSGKNLVTQRPAERPFARRARTVSGAGPLKLTIKAKGKAKRKLTKKGKLKVKPTITFTPTGGSAASQSLNVTLKKTKKK
jgi:Right handed beta helix region